jgi:type I restriction enzyme M protein
VTIVIAHKRAESRSRYYTRDEAQRVGWDVRHPAKGGAFLEEQELVNYFPVLKASLGSERPDFAVLNASGLLTMVIETKNDFDDIDVAASEAKQYVDTINQTKGFKVKVAVGVAGTPDKFVHTHVHFRTASGWKRLTSHGYPLTQLPNAAELQTAIENDDGTTDVQLPSESEFFASAISISRTLRLAAIEENVRPKVIGAIILALYEGDFSLAPNVVIENINNNVRAAVEDFKDVEKSRRDFLVRTLELSTESDKLRPAIADIVHQLVVPA